MQKKTRTPKYINNQYLTGMKLWNTSLQKSDVKNININPFTLIGDEWLLITGGDKSSFNTMTASWGSLGILWNKPIVICFIRPTRHTYSYIENDDFYTISFLGEENRDILKYCGKFSGRDTDKIAETGLKPLITDNNAITFEQAKLAFECKKIYYDDLKPVYFLPDDIDDKYYPDKDYHRMFIGELINVYKK